MANIRHISIVAVFLFLVSAFLLVPTFSNVRILVTETRYFTFDVDYGEQFKTTQGSSYNYLIGASTSYRKIGIRVYHGPTGFDSEVTSGSPVAVATYSATGLHSATWDCSVHALDSSDYVGVAAFIGDGTNWGGTAAWFITDTALGASQLDAATWTVYYYLTVISNKLRFYYGVTTYNSRVTNFQYTSAPSSTAYIADLSKALSTSWTVDTQTNYRIVPTQSLTSSWTIDTRTSFNIASTLSAVTSWLVDIIHTIAAQNYIADFTQALSTTWQIITQTDFNIASAWNFATTWDSLTKTDYSVNFDLSTVTTWIVDVSQGLAYSVDLGLAVVTSWVVDVLLELPSEDGLPILFALLVIVGLMVCMIAYVRKKRVNNTFT